MRIQRRRATTQEANALVLPPGVGLIDHEAHALRFHDNTTPGGLVIQGQRVEIPNGPGPQTLQAGDTTAGFYGEVTTDELIDGETLASEIGLTPGTPQHTTSPWLKFASNEKTLYIAKNKYRWNVSWTSIERCNAVYGGDDAPIVTVGDYSFKVRLIKGANNDPTSRYTNTHGEWGDLIYAVSSEDPFNVEWGVNYTEDELGISGPKTWCQETITEDANGRLYRGGIKLTYTYGLGKDNEEAWRPVLELIQ